MERVTVIPSDGRLCRDLDGTIVPKEGKEVPLNSYWNRRLKGGDCSLSADATSESSSSETNSQQEE